MGNSWLESFSLRSDLIEGGVEPAGGLS